MLEADSIEEVQQHNLVDFILSEYHDSFIATHKRVMSGESCIFEFEIKGIKGAQHWLETHAAPLSDAAWQNHDVAWYYQRHYRTQGS